MNETKERGLVKWQILQTWNGIRGGIIRLHIEKNRISFYKIFRFNNNEDFETAQKICKDKVSRILHFKNRLNTELARLATYCIEATSVEEMKDED